MPSTQNLVNPLTPVTPPPETQTFLKPSVPAARTVETKLKTPSIETPFHSPHFSIPPPPPFMTPSAAAVATAAATAASASLSAPTAATMASAATAHPSTSGRDELPMDPKYVATVSRIASFYQQRCLAITNYQQQRCQAWANMHKQKCQETMQAAMLVVAWYVRDRIQRRRRRRKDRFRTGLRERRSSPRISRGEVVRRWVLQVPEKALPPNSTTMDRLADKDEAAFSLDNETPPDRDQKLLEVADNLIRSQYRKIEVPLFGILSFDESDSEKENADNADSDMSDDSEDNGTEIEMDEDEDEEDDDEDEADDDDIGTGGAISIKEEKKSSDGNL